MTPTARKLILLKGVGVVPSAIPDFYVDSSRPDDTGDGLTLATAKKTLSAARALLTAGKYLALARGSYWREQFDIPANSITLGVVGSGDMPVIDGADVVTTGWTQPDAGTYPNVWSRSWTRSSATTTGSEVLGYWEAGARTTRRTSLANLQAGSNGDWHTTSLTNQTSTVSIRSAADPNSDGILREITKRHYGINGHSTILGASRTGVSITGPLEIKRCVGHYNTLTGPFDGSNKRLFLRDGNIHHTVTEGLLTEDVVATEFSLDAAPSVFVAYRADGSVFDHTFRRCLALLPGGASRPQTVNASAFYAHASTGNAEARNVVIDGCLSRGLAFGSASADSLTITNAYAEDAYAGYVGATSSVNTITRLVVRDTTTSGSAATIRYGVRRSSNVVFTPQLALTDSAIYIASAGEGATLGNTYPTTLEKTAFISLTGSPVAGQSGDRCAPTINRCILWGARTYNEFQTGYVGDFNVFYFIGQPAPQFHYNGTVYGGANMTAFQAASGQDANSVFLKAVDQVSGNGIAFWLGVSSGANAGPADGDWRINPSAKVYNGAGSALTGVFADGVTAITTAGPQGHYNYNTRAVVAGPPTRYPVLPATIAEMRTYLESPTTWNFYP